MITVEQLPDAGAPQAGITISGVGAGTAVVSVLVSWDQGASWHGVRDAERKTVTGGSAFFRDHVPPLNIPARYRLVVHQGTAPAVTETTVTVTSDFAWLQDPLAPRNAVAVRADLSPSGVLLTQGSLAGGAWQQAVDVAVPQGASLPVASVGQRVLAGEVPLVLSHFVAAEEQALRRMLMAAGALVLRGLSAGGLLQPVAHIVVGSVEERRVGLGRVSTWELSARQVRPTSMRIAVPWFTYDQVKAMWAGSTYNQVKAARPGDTYLDWARSPEVP